jgi:hypothetical protein
MRQWGDKRDILYHLNKFVQLKERDNEIVDDFNRIFNNNLYNKILVDINPSQPVAKVTYVGEFDLIFPWC